MPVDEEGRPTRLIYGPLDLGIEVPAGFGSQPDPIDRFTLSQEMFNGTIMEIIYCASQDDGSARTFFLNGQRYINVKNPYMVAQKLETSLRLVSGFHGQLETTYGLAYYMYLHACHVGKSVQWLMDKYLGLGLLTGFPRYFIENFAFQREFSRTFFPGLPYVVRTSRAVQSALELCMNAGHEIEYCRNSKHVSFQRITSRIPSFVGHLTDSLVPYWWRIRCADEIRKSLTDHLTENIILPEEFPYHDSTHVGEFRILNHEHLRRDLQHPGQRKFLLIRAGMPVERHDTPTAGMTVDEEHDVDNHFRRQMLLLIEYWIRVHPEFECNFDRGVNVLGSGSDLIGMKHRLSDECPSLTRFLGKRTAFPSQLVPHFLRFNVFDNFPSFHYHLFCYLQLNAIAQTPWTGHRNRPDDPKVVIEADWDLPSEWRKIHFTNAEVGPIEDSFELVPSPTDSDME